MAFSNGALIHRSGVVRPLGPVASDGRDGQAQTHGGESRLPIFERAAAWEWGRQEGKRRPAEGGIMAASERPDRTCVQPGQAGVTEPCHPGHAHFGTSGNCSENFENSPYHAPFGWLTRLDCHR